jgi:phage terminase Nu1 subunit (DNA packaging protein)
MPGEEGNWNLRDIARWKIAQIKTSGREKTAEEIEIELETARLDLAQKRLKYREAAGELVSRTAVMAEMELICNEIRCLHESMPESICSGLPITIKDDVKREAENQITIIDKFASLKFETLKESL